jgi:hypothetical protein
MAGVSASDEHLPPTSDQMSSPLWLAAGAALRRWVAGPPNALLPRLVLLLVLLLHQWLALLLSPTLPPPAPAWACHLLLRLVCSRGCQQPTSGQLLLCGWLSRLESAWVLLVLLLLPPTVFSITCQPPCVTLLPMVRRPCPTLTSLVSMIGAGMHHRLHAVNNHTGLVSRSSRFGQSLLNVGYTHAVVMGSLLFTLHHNSYQCGWRPAYTCSIY